MKRPWLGMLDTQVVQVDWNSGLTAHENRRVLRKTCGRTQHLDRRVWKEANMEECVARKGFGLIGVRWVDVDNGFEFTTSER